MTVITLKANGELVEWWLGHEWSKLVLEGKLEELPSPTGAMEPIICWERPKDGALRQLRDPL